MATISEPPSPHGSPSMPSQYSGLRKVLSNRRRSTELSNDSGLNLRTDTIDSPTYDKSPTRQSTHSSPSRNSSRSGSSGIRKYVPGHSKRQRRRRREEEMKAAEEERSRGRPTTSEATPMLSRKASSVGENSLLTDDSEAETPPKKPNYVKRDSHAPYLTTTSPLIKASTVPDRPETIAETIDPEPAPIVEASQSVPVLVEPPKLERSPSPRSPKITEPIPPSPNLSLFDKADALRPGSRAESTSSRGRGKSPAAKFRNVFSRASKSPRSSPERKDESASGISSPLGRSSTVALVEPEAKPKEPEEEDPMQRARRKSTTMPNITSDIRPLTPPTALMSAPVTTVTPPTPTDTKFAFDDGPKPELDATTREQSDPNVVVSPSGNMISHRRVRSAGSITHQPSKLSNSFTALTPTIEESRTPSGGSVVAPTGNTGNRTASSGSFFSSWVSAAQNAATTITNLAGQNRSRAGTTTSDMSQKTTTDTIKEEPEVSTPESPRKQMAVETMGSGDLNLEDLGIEGQNADTRQKPSLIDLRHNSTVQRDITAAMAEDALAKRAVSAAYEKSDATPVAEVPDPIGAMRHRDTLSSVVSGGEKTPPNGSILESDTGSIKRSNSVRSKLANRRSRGSSNATGQSAIGDLMRASTSALANPATGPRLSGFAIAPKQRNRAFHQQFRSVPEDDYLIEDYSCALQKEILLAGRIYISEGHICFSSNILGWVTTLVISFEEIVNVERENTALVIPNAIAIQTLHARHTFRSLLSREATYDLMIGIWKVSHPASFQKSMAGKQLVAEEATKEATGTGPEEDKVSEKDSEGSSEDESEGSDGAGSPPSLVESAPSMTASDPADGKTISRKPSGQNGTAQPQPSMDGTQNTAALAAIAGVPETAAVDYPGPTTHAPTDCTDASTHYDIIIKDEVLPAPLGKIYSLLYGAQSGAWVRSFLVDECKSLDLQLEDDKKGLSNEKKTRQYTYIKPLGGSIGPKQTKCITTEELDFFDLEKSVTVTCSTQTPDVPSGNAFLTKTRYCLTWATGNATRLQMNCTIEWSAKSWLKGPIEKGAKEGQGQYGDSLIKALKASIGRARGMTGTSKVSKSKKKGKKAKREKEAKVEEEVRKEENWGLLEPLRGPLGPVRDLARPILKMEYAVALLFFILFVQWIRGPRIGAVGRYAGLKSPERMAAYEEIWHREESELWDWLQARSGAQAVTMQGVGGQVDESAAKKKARKQRQQALKGKDAESKLREEKMSESEMQEAIRLTKEKLDVLEGVVKSRQMSR